MEIYFINSDASSNGGKSHHDAWFERGIAVTSGDKKFERELAKVRQGDVLGLYVNKVGIVGVGLALDNDLLQIASPATVSPTESIEYHRKVQWVADLRAAPIRVEDLMAWGAPPTPHAVRRVVQGKDRVGTKFAELLGCGDLHAREISRTLFKQSSKPIPQFEIGKTYNRRIDIHLAYGGNAQSGISTSPQSNAIFLFTGESGNKYGYADKDGYREDGSKIFFYTGEGQIGDMSFTRGNKAILHHSRDGRALHLFESLGKGKDQRYLGEFVYASHHSEPSRDLKGNSRQRIVFHLAPVSGAQNRFNEFDDESENGDEEKPKSLIQLRQLALAAISEEAAPPGEASLRTLYKRSKAVRDYVLKRSEGICESCNQPAPFVRPNGSPYLEPHHTTRLSDGGPDHPQNVGAICPACHRHIHYGKDGMQRNEALRGFLLSREAEVARRLAE